MGTFTKIPFTELLKSVPGFFGIRLEEEPRFDLIEEDGHFSIRSYPPLLLARVTVAATHDEALDQAFDRLARFIFGENSHGVRHSMTTPVLQDQDPHHRASHPVLPAETGSWTVSFFLSHDLDSGRDLVPDDQAIRIEIDPGHLVAAVRYSGNNTDERRLTNRDDLLRWIADHPGYETRGAVTWAQYDAPFVLPFAKRNEALVAIVPKKPSL